MLSVSKRSPNACLCLFASGLGSTLLLVLMLTLFTASGVQAQPPPSNSGSDYPIAPSNEGVLKPSISFVPRPLDPLGVDILPGSIGELLGGVFGTSNDFTQAENGFPILQDVIGPDNTPPPGHPDLSGYGVFLNNLSGGPPFPGEIRSLELLFSTPAGTTDISVDSYVRNNDLSFPEGPLVPTWDIEKQSSIVDGERKWHIVFNAPSDEDSPYRWLDANYLSATPSITGVPAFTILGSLFAKDSDISFSIIPRRDNYHLSQVPEPGSCALFLALSAAGFLAQRRVRRAR